jgi:hypothetical protein
MHPQIRILTSTFSSGFSRVYQVKEVDSAIRVMYMFDLHVPDSAPVYYDDLGTLDHQVKAISTASRAPHRFVDISRRSGDSAAKYFATMRTKDPDVFDRVQRAHFDEGSQAVTTDDSGLLWANRLVRTKHHLKDAGGHKHSPVCFGYLRIPASTATELITVSCWHTHYFLATIVSPSRIYRYHKIRCFASVGLLNPNEAWITLLPRSVPTSMLLSAPTFMQGYSTVILSSAPPALKQATPDPPSI